jgi:hypothetical protein
VSGAPLAPPAIVPPKKVARFISAEAAQSPLKLSAEGKLPELHLTESEADGAKREKPKGSNPWVLVGVVGLSLLTSILLVAVDLSPSSSPRSRVKQAARQVIESEYFSNLDSPEPREPYQILLRDAERAHGRGDARKERELYNKVLDLLRAERSPFASLTGTRARDQRLEEQVIILLSDH